MATPGIINEQGFVAGNGLGFNPFSEQDQKKVNSEDGFEKSKSEKTEE